jgi:hypothetical protein
MKTKRKIATWIFVAGILFSSCTSGQLSNQTLTPTHTSTFTSTRTLIPSQTFTLTPQPSATATSIPTWITNFAEPILQITDKRTADFQDDFSQNHHGWKYIPYGGSKPLPATLQNGVLSMAVTSTDTEQAQGWVEHPYLAGKDFILSFDFNIDQSNPQDHLTIIWFAKTSFVTLSLQPNDTWALGKTTSTIDWGSYNYNSSAQNSVLIIAKDFECGIYVNNAAIAHLNGCRDNNSGRAIWISLCVVAGRHTAVMNIDNVKIWNLDKISK